MQKLIKLIQLAILQVAMAIMNVVLFFLGAKPNLIKKKLFIGSMILAMIVFNSKKTQAQVDCYKTSVKKPDTIKITKYITPLIDKDQTKIGTCYLSAKELEPVQKKEPSKIKMSEIFIYLGGIYHNESFITKNLKYPKSARKKKIEGIVNVSFIVKPDGSITNVYIQNGIGYGCDEEALRIVKLMSKCEPYVVDGKAVWVRYLMPVKFKL